jgi:2-polyprenyl-3-methyl-5-hydroxy-6-metoxy-1,4-benzoquinol methylase
MKGILLFSCILMLPVTVLICQENPDQQALAGIANYRSVLLTRHVEDRHALAAVKVKLDSAGVRNEDFINLTVAVNTLLVLIEEGDPYADRFLQNLLNQKAFANRIDREDIAVLVSNADLFGLMGLGVLESNYPHKVDRNMELHKELAFYQISNGMQIADIGAGNGELCAVLCFVYDSVEVFCNDIDQMALRTISRKQSDLQDVMQSSRMHVIIGSKFSANLPENAFDRIIIRNTLHHFKRTGPMLASVLSALRDSGMLMISEPLYVSRKHNTCKKMIRETKILRMLTRAGFQLETKEALTYDTLYLFVKS